MAQTEPKMNLVVWDQLDDPFDNAQLADNMFKIGWHDHTPGRGVQIPTEGIFDGAVTAAKLASGLDSSGVYASYKNVIRMSGGIGGNTAAGTYLLAVNGTAQVLASSVGTQVFYFDPADYVSPAGRTHKLRIRLSGISNAVAPGVTFTSELRAVTGWGGASGITPSITTLGSSVGSTAAMTLPATSQVVAVSSDFTPPAAGRYVLTIVPSGTTAAGASTFYHVELQSRQV